MDLSKPFNYPFSDENRVKRKQSFELISDAPAEGLEGLYELVERAQKMEDEREKRDQEEPAKPDHGTVTPPPPEVKVERRKTLASLIPSLPDDLFRVNLVRFKYIFSYLCLLHIFSLNFKGSFCLTII